MKTLLEIYNKHYDPKTGWPDKGTVHSYIEVYEEILAHYRGTAKNILEIGLMSGESLRMWDEYFTGDVFGIDCDIKPIGGKADLTKAIEDGLCISIGDATNESDIEKFYKGIKFDVIIEDAGHELMQQMKIFSILVNYLSDDGIYIIEDVQSMDNAKTIRNSLYDFNTQIIDRRNIKNRYDDILIIIKK
jgi:SAM-dependent methyltransferase